MEQMEKLRCPFCGGETVVIDENREEEEITLKCSNCEAQLESPLVYGEHAAWLTGREEDNVSRERAIELIREEWMRGEIKQAQVPGWIEKLEGTLKPCPFCGGRAEVAEAKSSPDKREVEIRCRDCNAHTGAIAYDEIGVMFTPSRDKAAARAARYWQIRT